MKSKTITQKIDELNAVLTTALCFVLICGCATGTHIVTGIIRPPIKPSQVVLYQVPPAKCEVIGIVNSKTGGVRQGSMNAAVKELKVQAAKIGANGIIIGISNQGSNGITTFGGSGATVSDFGIQLSGQAIYVAP